jgi:hypothetical protein
MKEKVTLEKMNCRKEVQKTRNGEKEHNICAENVTKKMKSKRKK